MAFTAATNIKYGTPEGETLYFVEGDDLSEVDETTIKALLESGAAVADAAPAAPADEEADAAVPPAGK